MKLRVVDTETCDFDGGIVEIASIDIVDGVIDFSTQQSHLVNPHKPISINAMAVHHITDEMIQSSPVISDVIGSYRGSDYLVAHNADFDKRMMPEMEAPFICTLKLARRLWPDMESHSNQYLRYALNLDVNVPDGLHAHRALYDCIVTAALMQMILECSGWTFNEMIEISNQPSLLNKLRFGKYKGMTFTEVKKENPGYLDWLSKQDDLDPDVAFSLDYWRSRQ